MNGEPICGGGLWDFDDKMSMSKAYVLAAQKATQSRQCQKHCNQEVKRDDSPPLLSRDPTWNTAFSAEASNISQKGCKDQRAGAPTL